MVEAAIWRDYALLVTFTGNLIRSISNTEHADDYWNRLVTVF